MNDYISEINRIKSICYSNQTQINTVIKMRSYIEEHYDTDLDLNLLSQVHYTSKFHLLRLFKRYYGLTPRQYLIERRIEKSKEFLRSGMNVTQTCFAVGFESLSSFTALFKRKTGLLPSEYQKKQFSRSNLHSF